MRAAGEIADLELQPRWSFPINGRFLKVGDRVAHYTADFRYRRTSDGETIVEEVKGFMQPDAALRIGLMKVVHGIDVAVIRKGKKA